MGYEDDYQDLHFNEDGEAQAAFNRKAINDAPKHHPVEQIEPQILELSDYDKGYRDAYKHYYPTLDAAFSHILLSDDKVTALYQAAFALNLHGICQNKSMEEIAIKCGVTRACMSKGAKQFIESLNLPTSTYMKDTIDCFNYQKARIERVKRKHNKPKDY